jgi:hypothetical protein
MSKKPAERPSKPVKESLPPVKKPFGNGVIHFQWEIKK